MKVDFSMYTKQIEEVIEALEEMEVGERNCLVTVSGELYGMKQVTISVKDSEGTIYDQQIVEVLGTQCDMFIGYLKDTLEDECDNFLA